MGDPGAHQRVLVGELRGGGGRHAHHVSAHLIVAVAGDRHALGRLVEEPAGQRPPLIEMTGFEHRRDPIRVTAAQVVDPVVAAALPAESPPDRRILDQVRHVDQDQPVTLASSLVQVVDDPLAELALALLVAAAQVGVQSLADQLVQREPVTQRLGEGQRSQPLVGGVGIAVGQYCPEHLDRGDPRDRGHPQCGQPNLAELALREPADQRPDDLRLGDVKLRLPRAVRHRRLGGERQRQRRAFGPIDHRCRPVVIEPVICQQIQRLQRMEGLELDLGRHGLPAAGEPTGVRSPASGDHHHGSVRKRGQQPAAQISVQRRHPLIGVDQHERAVAGARARQDRLERIRHRRQLTALDKERLLSSRLRAARQLPEQRALADPTGPVHQDDVGRRVVLQAALEEPELDRPAHEPIAIAIEHPHGERPAARLHTRVAWAKLLFLHHSEI